MAAGRLTAMPAAADLDARVIHEPIAGIAAQFEFPVLVAQRTD